MPQSIEPNIADLINGWLKSCKLGYKLKQGSLNAKIDKALKNYDSNMIQKRVNMMAITLMLRCYFL